MMYPPDVSKGVRLYAEKRKELGWTLRHTGKLLNVSPGHLCRIESGQRQPGPNIMVALSRLFKIGLLRFMEADK